jgi:hypothetical protein
MSTKNQSAAADNGKALTVQQMVYNLLSETQDQLNEILSDQRHSFLKSTVNGALNKLKARFRTGSQANTTNNFRKTFAPLVAAAPEEGDIKSPAALEGDEIAKEIAAIYESFPYREVDEILDSVDETRIRAVAKKAGLQVTETEPEKINTAFIVQIKEAMVKKAELTTLVNDPKQTVADELTKTNERLDKLATERAGIEKALSAQGLHHKKKASLTKRLEILTAEETNLFQKRDELTQALEGDGSEDQQ